MRPKRLNQSPSNNTWLRVNSVCVECIFREKVKPTCILLIFRSVARCACCACGYRFARGLSEIIIGLGETGGEELY